MKRRGIASIWALVTLSVVTVMTAAILSEFLSMRRGLDARQNRAQVERLAEAGEEIALAKLQAAKDYRGETLKLLANGDAVITVTAVEKLETFRIAVEAHFPMNQPRAAMKRIERIVRFNGNAIEIVE